MHIKLITVIFYVNVRSKTVGKHYKYFLCQHHLLHNFKYEVHDETVAYYSKASGIFKEVPKDPYF